VNNKRLGLMIVLITCFLGCLLGIQRVSALQIVLSPGAEEVRFQLIGNEPIAGPDGRSLVSGWSVLVFKDRKAGQCYVAFKQGPAITATEAATCPQ
jgi:hypothetical protein